MINRRSLIAGALAVAALPRFSWAAARAPGRAIRLDLPLDLAPAPMPTLPLADGSLPRADVVVMVDTAAEVDALADVLTPGVSARAWVPYVKNFEGHFLRQVGPRGPSRRSRRLGSFHLTRVGELRVLAYKTELHLHTDARPAPGGGHTMPIAGMLNQIIVDARPRLFLTTGTAGGVDPRTRLGDVVVSRAAMFRCRRDFVGAPFNGKTFRSDWSYSTAFLEPLGVAERIMSGLAGNLGGGAPPSAVCAAEPAPRRPLVWFDGENGVPEFHPIITTDYFEFGTTENHLDKVGMAVEMDDAVLGLVCSRMNTPRWACVRNLSDPTISGALPDKLQGQCAEFYYSRFGYWTSVNSALVAWAITAGEARS